jgi:hypothetical protein
VKYIGPKARRIPTEHELHVLRVLKRERHARTIEIVEASRGKVPRNQAWMLLHRLMERGAIRVARRIDSGRGGSAVPVYALTVYGQRVLRAMAILEAA